MTCRRLLLALLFLSIFSFAEEPAVQIARVKKLSTQELESVHQRAQGGDAAAQLILGLAYDGANHGVKPDAVAARRWYEMSAKQGNLDAQFWLVGLDYQQGQQFSLVAPRYLDLAKAGHVGAMSVYAGLCSDGVGGPKDFRAALSWWKKAAELGSAEGAFNVGIMYLDGEGVPVDEAQGVEWLGRAANEGNAAAAGRLGAMALMRKNGLQPGPEATKWLKTAAETGDGLSMFNLGMVLFHGLGAQPDYVEAYKWFTLSADRGQVDGRNGMIPKMTTDQVAAGEKLAAAWKAEHKD